MSVYEELGPLLQATFTFLKIFQKQLKFTLLKYSFQLFLNSFMKKET